MKQGIKNVPKDKAVFKNTAKKIKKVNLGKSGFRGGIRL